MEKSWQGWKRRSVLVACQDIIPIICKTTDVTAVRAAKKKPKAV